MTKPPEPYCDTCRNTGWKPVMVDGTERLARCPGCIWLDWKHGGVAGVPVDELKSLLATFTTTADNQAALAEAVHFLKGIHPGLYLWGGVGTGKTKLACTILNELAKQGVFGRFQRVTELLLKLMPGWDDDDNHTGRMFWDQLTTTPVLVLDDLGADQGTDFSRRTLQALYDKRLDLGHRTIFTSNLDLDDLQTFLNDQRLPSRIVGECKVVKMDGKDWRLKARKRKAAASKAAEPPKERSWTGSE